MDPSKFLKNISYTLNNVNLDINIGLKENYDYFNLPNHLDFIYKIEPNYYMPSIETNFIKEEKLDSKEDKYNQNIRINEQNGKVQCNCRKSKCLKLYCECFSNGDYCANCNCVDCHNVEKYEEERDSIIK